MKVNSLGCGQPATLGFALSELQTHGMMPPEREGSLSSFAQAAKRRETEELEFRIGIGHDIHRLVLDRELVLGGVPVEFDRGLEGHSDADVLLHAVIDAILGAAGLGDIGEWFPNTQSEWQGADSSRMISESLRAVRLQSWSISNLDCTIFAEEPKLTQHKQKIRKRLAELLEIDTDAVNVKAKTGERVGPVGRKEAMAAQAVVLLTREERHD